MMMMMPVVMTVRRGGSIRMMMMRMIVATVVVLLLSWFTTTIATTQAQSSSSSLPPFFSPTFTGGTRSPGVLPIPTPTPSPDIVVGIPTVVVVPVPVPVPVVVVAPTPAPIVVVVTESPMVVVVPTVTLTPTMVMVIVPPPTTSVPTLLPTTLPPTTLPPTTLPPVTTTPTPTAVNVTLPPSTTSPAPSVVNGTISTSSPSSLAPIAAVVPTIPVPTIPTPVPTTSIIAITQDQLYLIYPNVTYTDLDNQTDLIASIHSAWFEDYMVTFRSTSYPNFTTTMNITSHGPVEVVEMNGDDEDTDNDVPTMMNSTFIVYTQSIQYNNATATTNTTSTRQRQRQRQQQEEQQDDADNNVNRTDIPDVFVQPFTDPEAVLEYMSLLQMAFPETSFDAIGTISPPIREVIPTPSPTQAPTNRLDDPIIATIILAGVAGFALLGGVIYLINKATTSTSSDGQQSKEVVGGGDGMDNKERSTTMVSNQNKPKTSIEPGTFIVYAPSGKLGFSLDQPDSGPLIIYVVKDDSPLSPYIRSGDRLIGVDAMNVTKSNPAKVVGLLRERNQQEFRKLTLIRADETTTLHDVDQQYVVYAPVSTKLGFSLDKDEDIEHSAPTVRVVKPTSILFDTVEVGDELIQIDTDVDTRTITAKECVLTLKQRSTNPIRKLTFVRIMPSAAELAAVSTAITAGESKYDDDDDPAIIMGENHTDGYVVAFAPAGPLGFALQNVDDASTSLTTMAVHSMKQTSPLLHQIKTGDTLIGVDAIDVRNLSPTRIINLLATRKSNMYRKLTIVRRNATIPTLGDSTIQLESGIIVVYVPATKLGFSLNSIDDGSPVFEIFKDDSILNDTARVGDRLVQIDEINTSAMPAGKAVKLLAARKMNPYRRLVIQRGSMTTTTTGRMTSPTAIATPVQMTGERYTVIAPAGKLGIILDNPDDGAPIINTVKDTSPLLGQMNVGDRLVRIDSVDVSSFSPAQVVQLLSSKSTNPERVLTMLRPPSMATTASGQNNVPSTTTFTVIAPAGKLGIILDNPDDGAPIINTVKDTSPLLGKMTAGDRLVRIDDVDVSSYTPAQVVQLLSSKSTNPERALTMSRPSTSVASTISSGLNDDITATTYTVAAPAGKLGVILDNPDDGAPVIHTVKDTSPLLGQITIGDRLVRIDDVDVSSYTPAQVVQLLSTKSNNPERVLTLVHPLPTASGSDVAVTSTTNAEVESTEPEIVVGNDGESTVGGEYIEDTGDEATAATADQ